MAYEVKGDLIVTGDNDATSGGSGSVGSSGPVPVITAKATLGLDSMKSAISGTGRLVSSIGDDGNIMQVGGDAKADGRIYCDGRFFYVNGQRIFMMGSNAPFVQWNEFGSTNGFNETEWRNTFQRAVDQKHNCIRIWFNCDTNNIGITLDSDGYANAPTAQFWLHADKVMAMAEEFGIYVMACFMSFDHFNWSFAGSDRYFLMLGSVDTMQSFINNVLIAFCERYKNNVYLFSIDLCNEMDNSYEDMARGTPAYRHATPVGGGSTYVDFDFRVPDWVTDLQLYMNGTNMGTVAERTSDTRVKCNNGYSGASATFEAGTWGFTAMSRNALPRFAAYASKAIHALRYGILVTCGMASLKAMSPYYDWGDTLSDSKLQGYTGDTDSYIDFHGGHHYSWGERWFTPFGRSPALCGLSEKPAMLCEFSGCANEMNHQYMNDWRPFEYLSAIQAPYRYFHRRKVGDTYEVFSTPGGGTNGPIPIPTGLNAGDTYQSGTLTWTKVSPSNTWRPGCEYGWSFIILADAQNTGGKGRLYEIVTPGTSAADGVGPTGLVESDREAWEAGHSYTLNTYVISNGGFYKVKTAGVSAKVWAQNTNYSTGTYVANGGKFYRATTSVGTSAAEGTGPSGTGTGIVDGSVLWSYAGTCPDPYVGPAGYSDFTDGSCVWQYDGVATTLVDGTCVWQFKRDPFDSYLDILNMLKDTNWAGGMYWSIRGIDQHGKFSIWGKKHLSGYACEAWQPNTNYSGWARCYVKDGDDYHIYVLANGTSESQLKQSGSTAPSGTGRSITDNQCVWCYYETVDSTLQGETGRSCASFATTFNSLVHPNIEGQSAAVNAGSVIRQSANPVIYVPGVDTQASLTFQFTSGLAGVRQCAGLFDDDDGLYLARDGEDDAIIIRRLGSDFAVPRLSWNLDRMDGTGDSGLSLDFTKVNTVTISLGWLHGNANRVGFIVDGQTYWAHEFYINNQSSPVMPSNPNLPLRWQITSSSTVAEFKTMKSYVGYAARSPVALARSSRAWSNNDYGINVTASSRRAVVLLRMSELGMKNGLIRPTRIYLSDASGEDVNNNWYQHFRWAIYLNPTLDYSPTWANVSTLAQCSSGPGLDYDTGSVLARGHWHRNLMYMDLPNMPWLAANPDGTSDVIAFVAGNMSTQTRYYYIGMEWEERT